MKQPDKDLQTMTVSKLRQEVKRLRRGIRRHRDARNNSRCWLLDLELYRLLPEVKARGTITLPRQTFLRNCSRYYDRQTGGEGPAIPRTNR